MRWFFVWLNKITVDNLKMVVFLYYRYHLFENRLSEFLLTMIIRFLIQLRTKIANYIFHLGHQKINTCIKKCLISDFQNLKSNVCKITLHFRSEKGHRSRT